jgi:hypothetical protein
LISAAGAGVPDQLADRLRRSGVISGTTSNAEVPPTVEPDSKSDGSSVSISWKHRSGRRGVDQLSR